MAGPQEVNPLAAGSGVETAQPPTGRFSFEVAEGDPILNSAGFLTEAFVRAADEFQAIYLHGVYGQAIAFNPATHLSLDKMSGGDSGQVIAAQQSNTSRVLYDASVYDSGGLPTRPIAQQEPAIAAPEQLPLMISMGLSSNAQEILNPVTNDLLQSAKDILLQQLRTQGSPMYDAVAKNFDTQNVQINLSMGTDENSNPVVMVEAEHLDGTGREAVMAFSLSQPHRVQTTGLHNITSA